MNALTPTIKNASTTFNSFAIPTVDTVDLGSSNLSIRRFQQRPNLSLCSTVVSDKALNSSTYWPISSFSQIGMVTTGCLRFFIPDKGQQELRSGDWFVSSFGQFTPRFEVEGNTSITWIECDQHLWQSLASDSERLRHTNIACLGCTQRTEAFFLKGESTPELLELASRLSIARGETANKRLLIESMTLNWLSLILDQSEFSDFPNTEPCDRHEDESALLAAARILEENLVADHSIAGISRSIYLNEFKLKRGFRERFNTTVFGYLRQKRMERAHELLRQGGMTVLQVSEEVGYSNPSHFSRAFREAFGLNPKDITS